MKGIKKLFALLLALIMVVALAAPAFADDETNTEETATTDNTPATTETTTKVDISSHTFTAYQIFTATSITEDGQLGNLAWANGVTDAMQEEILRVNKVSTLKALIAKLGGMTDNSGAAKAFARQIYNIYTANSVTGTAFVNGTTVLPLGYWLIADTTVATAEKPVEVYNLSVLQVSDNTNALTIVSKVEVPSSDKKIRIANGETVEKVNVNEASIGDEVDYELKGTLPGNLSDYVTYYYSFRDTMSKGLTYKADSLKVYINNDGTETDVTNEFTVNVGTYSETAGTSITVTNSNIKAITGVTASTVVYVRYAATLNTNAVIAGPNENTVDLVYSNNPDISNGGSNDPHGETPKSTVETYTTELTITKVNDQNKFLPGTEFTLSGDSVNIILVTKTVFTASEEGTWYKLNDGTYTEEAPTEATAAGYEDQTTKYAKETTVTEKTTTAENKNVVGVVGDDGKVTFTGLGACTYTLTETKTLAGYNTIAPIEFTVSFDAATKTFATNNADIKVGTDNKIATTIINYSGSTLPSTGGIGTTIFYITGAVLMVAAGVLLITKRRMNGAK